MARVRRVTLNPAGMRRLVHDPSTPTYRQMQRIGAAILVASAARAPKRSGRLATSGRYSMRPRYPKLTTRVGFYTRYAWWAHEGRGPVHAKPGGVLRWVDRGGRVRYAKRVGPARGTPFLRQGTKAVTGKTPRRRRGN